MAFRKLFTLFAGTALLATGMAFAAGQTASPTRTVASFYTWYFANQANWTNISGARQYLTPSLYASLAKVLAEEQKEHAAILDFNPFVNAQEEAQSYSTGTPSGSGATRSVPVQLRFAHIKGAGTVRVIVVRAAGGWKIDNFVYPGAGDLRRTLRDALK